MRTFSRWLIVALLAASILAIPARSYAGVFFGVGVAVNIAPPPLPLYVQPVVPGPNYLWMPGYWAWGPAGYYWVPGTWVLAPRPGWLWTPGYWGWAPGGYFWHAGFWGPHVGFYGGINYGFGYFGAGFVGGGWFGGVFRYNTAVTNVNTTIVRNVYVDRTVVNNFNNVTVNRVSYNGGAGGSVARPNAAEVAAQNDPHVGMTAEQMAHVRTAGRDRGQLASVNHGQPAALSAQHPFSRANRPESFAPIQAEDRSEAQSHVDRAAQPQRPQSYRAQPYHAQSYHPQPSRAQPYRTQSSHQEGAKRGRPPR